jgi:hypothetical protein
MLDGMRKGFNSSHDKLRHEQGRELSGDHVI